MTFQTNQQAYAKGVGLTTTSATFIASRDPTTADVNYSIVGSSGSGNTYGSYCFNNPGSGSRFAVGSCRINSFITQSAGLADVDTVCVAVFR